MTAGNAETSSVGLKIFTIYCTSKKKSKQKHSVFRLREASSNFVRSYLCSLMLINPNITYIPPPCPTC